MKKRITILAVLFAMALCIPGCSKKGEDHGKKIDGAEAQQIITKLEENVDKYKEETISKFTLRTRVKMDDYITDYTIKYSEADNYFYMHDITKNFVYESVSAGGDQIEVTVNDNNQYYNYIDADGNYIYAEDIDSVREESNKTTLVSDTVYNDRQRYRTISENPLDEFKNEQIDVYEDLEGMYSQLSTMMMTFVPLLSYDAAMLESFGIKLSSKGEGHLYMSMDMMGSVTIIELEDYFISYLKTEMDFSSMQDMEDFDVDYEKMTTEMWFDMGVCDIVYPDLAQFETY